MRSPPSSARMTMRRTKLASTMAAMNTIVRTNLCPFSALMPISLMPNSSAGSRLPPPLSAPVSKPVFRVVAAVLATASRRFIRERIFRLGAGGGIGRRGPTAGQVDLWEIVRN